MIPEQVLLRVEVAMVSKNVDNPRFFKGFWFRTIGLSTASDVIIMMGTRAAGSHSSPSK